MTYDRDQSLRRQPCPYTSYEEGWYAYDQGRPFSEDWDEDKQTGWREAQYQETGEE